MKVIMFFYRKNYVQNKWAVLGPKMVHHHNSGSALRIFLKKICRVKGTNKYMRIILVIFLEKKSFGAVWSLCNFVLFDWTWSSWARPLFIGSLNSQDMISFMITTRSLNRQDMIMVLKQWRHHFSAKHLCDGYCMDIIWCLCMEGKIHGEV